MVISLKEIRDFVVIARALSYKSIFFTLEEIQYKEYLWQLFGDIGVLLLHRTARKIYEV
jgi:hypothetical protein